MGISSNQARFLSLTARQVDLEHRVQQICQRRLRLSSELERVATDYNNQIGNRKMFTFSTTNSGIDTFDLAHIRALKDSNGNNYAVMALNGGVAGAYNGTGDYSTSVVILGSAAACTGLKIDSVPGGSNVDISLAQLGLDSGTHTESEVVEAAVRAGLLIIVTKSDEFTQSPENNHIGILSQAGDPTYELRDWRTLPEIADELFKGDDMDAENKYDRIVSQINQQDKKLQLEQASVEVEYKAISSEKEAVKKILDTNAGASFKYFS